MKLTVYRTVYDPTVSDRWRDGDGHEAEIEETLKVSNLARQAAYTAHQWLPARVAGWELGMEIGSTPMVTYDICICNASDCRLYSYFDHECADTCNCDPYHLPSKITIVPTLGARENWMLAFYWALRAEWK